MKIIQTFWSCKQSNLLNFNAGWIAPEYNLMSWALSCLQLRQYYEDVTLYSDTTSAKMLIDILKLPYTNVVCNLDSLNHYHKDLWAMPKIHTYSQQETPFLHVDGDVYIWKKFEDTLLNSSLIAQNLEAATDYYGKIITSLERELAFFPKEIMAERKLNSEVFAYNAGILGGINYPFFKQFAEKAVEFVDNNISCLENINITDFNLFFEQYLFYCYAKQKNLEVNVLLSDTIGDNEYINFGDFCDVPYNKQYLHLLGSYKRSKQVCQQLANQLRKEYPEYYYRIISLYKQSNTSLFIDHYADLKNPSEQDLVSRYNTLNNKFLKDNLSHEDFIREQKYKNDEIPCYRTDFLEQLINSAGFTSIMSEHFIHNNIPPQKDRDYDLILKDLKEFETTIIHIQKTKFHALSKEYFYLRDIHATHYARLLFEHTEHIHEKVIVSDDLIEKIKSRYDWSNIETNGTLSNYKTIQQLAQPPGNIYTIIIPESTRIGYSLLNIDELDSLILTTIQNPISIGNFLNQMKPFFDEEDLKASQSEFEELILGRVKMGLQNKTIRVLQ